MNKLTIKCSFTVLIVLFLANILLGASSFNVTEDTVLTYEVVNAELSGCFGENNLTTEGMRIAGKKVLANDQFNVSVNKVYEDSIDFDYEFDGESEHLILISAELNDNLIYHLLYPFAESEFLVNNYNFSYPYYANSGILKIFTVFVEPQQSTWDKLTNLRYDFIQYYHGDYGYEIAANYEYDIKEKRTELQFECFIDVLMLDVPNYNFSYSLGYKFTYNKVAGYLLGSKFQFKGEGMISNKTVDTSSVLQVELEGYNLEDFQIGEFATNKVHGFTFPLIIVVLISIKLLLSSKKINVNRKRK